jgi:hypothetical protein
MNIRPIVRGSEHPPAPGSSASVRGIRFAAGLIVLSPGSMNAMALRLLAGVLLCAIAGFAMAGDAPAAEPGVLIDNRRATQDVRPFLERAVASATAQAGHPVVLFVDETGTAGEQADRLAERWPERTIVAVNIFDNLEAKAAIRPAAEMKDRFEASTLARIEGEIAEGMRSGRLNKAMAGAVLEVGAIAAGQRPLSRGAWKHPIQLLTGGKDVTDDERLYFLFGTMVALLLLYFVARWFRWFADDPKAAIMGLFIFFLEAGIGGGGRGGGGGGGMSGGGGGFAGGGATGSW